MSAGRLAACVAAVGLAAGCTAGPEYHRPAAGVAGTNAASVRFAEETAGGVDWKPAEPADGVARGRWWGSFHDPVLDQLEDLVRGANPTLAAAQARYAQAEAAVKVSRSAYFPDLTAPASVTRQRESYGTPNNGHPARVTPTYNNLSVALQASWEVDLWGRVRRQVEGARARLDAGRADLESVRLALESETAIDYYSLRSLDAQRRVLEQTLAADRKALELNRNRRHGGIATDLDVAQAETQVRSIEAAIPAVDLDRARLRHALAALTGRPYSEAGSPAGTPPLAEPQRLAAGLPSNLLERRPDVAAAERLAMAANADIGVAKAAFFPSLTIGGLAGFDSVSAGNLLGMPNRFWSVGPSVSLPLFTGGRLRGNLDLAKAGYDAAVAAYRETVLEAIREVEDQLAAERLLSEEQAAQRLGLAAARRTLEIASNRYEAGLVTYLEVVTAQTTALQFEQRVEQLQGERWLAAIGLIKAIGGGWEGLGAAGGPVASGGR